MDKSGVELGKPYSIFSKYIQIWSSYFASVASYVAVALILCHNQHNICFFHLSFIGASCKKWQGDQCKATAF